jgi:hypothetical protein
VSLLLRQGALNINGESSGFIKIISAAAVSVTNLSFEAHGSTIAGESEPPTEVVFDRKPLRPNSFYPLPLTSIRTRVIENECHLLVGFFGRYEHPLLFLENRFEADPQFRKEVACDFLGDRFARFHVERFSFRGGELWMSEVAFSGKAEGSAVKRRYQCLPKSGR